MDIELLLIAVLSHNIFDFILQIKLFRCYRFPVCKGDGRDLKRKKNIYKTVKGNLMHTSSHFIGLCIIVFIINSIKNNPVIFPMSKIIIICIAHFFIDEIKSLIYLFRTSTQNNIWVFLFDQLVHLIVISLVSFNCDITYFISQIKIKLFNYPKSFNFTEKVLLTSIIFIVSTWAVGIFIKVFINYISSEANKINITDDIGKNIIGNNGSIIKIASTEAKNGGYLIGILERILILISIAMNYPVMIGFVLTAKSVARLKKLSNDSFAEYFIIGTFFSFIAAVLGGIIIRSLFN
ncbi:DUF3307 domain-containing protein [Clostridium fungisolvens]|uniref:DUF3307 domain-containing protein n=1 Tax=Clostridium fungisolvens TaxID=1604897 RepID=A0A6V8SF43_9CLOT|nr:DUF3307 domain-containing protein [Clostridium fungisolvens]GFP75670.1 hypothetical protein bsdtw1_01761 [Clostridium fungisolvens]